MSYLASTKGLGTEGRFSCVRGCLSPSKGFSADKIKAGISTDVALPQKTCAQATAQTDRLANFVWLFCGDVPRQPVTEFRADMLLPALQSIKSSF